MFHKLFPINVYLNYTFYLLICLEQIPYPYKKLNYFKRLYTNWLPFPLWHMKCIY